MLAEFLSANRNLSSISAPAAMQSAQTLVFTPCRGKIARDFFLSRVQDQILDTLIGFFDRDMLQLYDFEASSIAAFLVIGKRVKRGNCEPDRRMILARLFRAVLSCG